MSWRRAACTCCAVFECDRRGPVQRLLMSDIARNSPEFRCEMQGTPDTTTSDEGSTCLRAPCEDVGGNQFRMGGFGRSWFTPPVLHGVQVVAEWGLYPIFSGTPCRVSQFTGFRAWLECSVFGPDPGWSVQAKTFDYDAGIDPYSPPATDFGAWELTNPLITACGVARVVFRLRTLP